jgi:HEAT repeat protein
VKKADLDRLGVEGKKLERDWNAEIEAAKKITPLLGEKDAAFKMARRFSDSAGAWSSDQDRESARVNRAYDQGTKALDSRRWDAAVQAFAEVIAAKGARADGALYWTAWAQNKQGNRAEALATLEKLRSGYPNSRWMGEAKVLEAEIRQSSGQPVKPENTDDEELKLLALNGLMHSDAERAVPMIEKLLQGSDSLKLKERALFVLAQSGSPQARRVLAEVAKGGRNPDLQERAVHYLGVSGGTENRQLLEDIYKSSSNVEVKRRILRAFMVSGDREKLLAAARNETTVELRREAIRQLGVMNAQEELWQLYQNETTVDNKKEIIRALFVGGASDRLIQLAQTEKDLELRRTAVQNLGVMDSQRTGAALVSLYGSEKDPQIRRSIVQGLFVQNNARALVDLARKETDPELKKLIVSRLSNMKAKEATDYLMELLMKEPPK